MRLFIKSIKTKNWWIAPLLILFIVACNNSAKTKEAKATQKDDKVQKVEVVKPEKRQFTAEVLISGTVKANQMVSLHAMENGYIKKMYKDIGDKVREGELIAVLENPELHRQYDKQKAELEGKKSIYERLNSIYEKTPALTSVQMVEESRAAYLGAKADFEAISDRIGFLKVKAPFSGVVTRRFYDKGALVQSGISNSGAKPIVEVHEIDPVRVSIPLPESDVAAIKEGMAVEVIFPELSGKSYNAKISRIANSLDPASKTMEVEIDIKNPKGDIKPGTYAKVKIQLKSREDVLSLPLQALLLKQGEYSVLEVQDNKVRVVPVMKGLSNKERFEVLNPAINEKSMIVTEGKGLVKAGQTVTPIIQKGEAQ